MSAKRAAIKRDKKKREKLEKRKDLKGKAELICLNGRDKGRELAYICVIKTLRELYGFGERRLDKLNEEIRDISSNADNEVVLFVVKNRIQKILDEMDKDYEWKIKTRTIYDQLYSCRRDEGFVMSVAVMLTALGDVWNYSTNSKGTGRLDSILKSALVYYTKYTYDSAAMERDKRKLEKELDVKF